MTTKPNESKQHRDAGSHQSQKTVGRDQNTAGRGGNTAGRIKQIAAIIGIVLLVAMYVVTLAAACIGSDSAGRLFRLCLGLTIAVPIFLWIFIWCVGVLTHKGSMASMDILDSNPEERARMEQAIRDMKEQEEAKNADN